MDVVAIELDNLLVIDDYRGVILQVKRHFASFFTRGGVLRDDPLTNRNCLNQSSIIIIFQSCDGEFP